MSEEKSRAIELATEMEGAVNETIYHTVMISKSFALNHAAELRRQDAEIVALRAQPAKPVTDERELPPIPEPTRLLYSPSNGHVYGFTVAQMQEYARAALNQPTEQSEPIALVHDMGIE